MPNTNIYTGTARHGVGEQLVFGVFLLHFFFFTVALYFYFWLPHFFLVPSGRDSAKLCRSVPGMGVNESVGPGWLRSCALCAVRCSSLVKLPRLTQKADGCGGQASTGEIYNLSFPGTRKIGFYGKRMNITKIKKKKEKFSHPSFRFREWERMYGNDFVVRRICPISWKSLGAFMP